jgi:hypothetical protein
LGCWVEALALDREAGVCWRKAAKKVERKKGRWDDMVPLVTACAGVGLEGVDGRRRDTEKEVQSVKARLVL